MVLAKFLTGFLMLTATTCLARIVIESSESKRSSIVVEAAVNILTSCYPNSGNAIGLVGEVPKNLLSTLLLNELVPVVLLSPPEVMHRYHVPKLQYYPLNKFVVVASSIEEFDINLDRLEGSIWWNHTGSFIVLYQPVNLCENTEDILYNAFHKGVINPTIICVDREKKLSILAGNYYTCEVPAHWRLIKSVKRKWQMLCVYSRKYEKGTKICDNLNFVDTKNTWGREMRVLNIRNLHTEPILAKDVTLDSVEFYEYQLAVFQHVLNGTLKIIDRTIYNNAKEAFDKNAFIYWNYADFVYIPTRHTAGIMTRFYPTDLFHVFALTKFRGPKTQLQKIISIIDLTSRIGLCLVMIVTWIFFKFFVNFEVMPALLNVFRIICNTGFRNSQERLAVRFYLTGLLFFALIMHGIQGGRLASLLTLNIPHPDIENLKDLVESDLAIYDRCRLGKLSIDIAQRERVYTLPQTQHCGRIVEKQPGVACLDHELQVRGWAWNLNLHVSRDPIISVYFSSVVHRNYPFIKRLNKAILRIRSAGMDKSSRLAPMKGLDDIPFGNVIMLNGGFKVMVLGELAFAFVILGIGLICATITFIIELAIKRYRSKVKSVQVQVLN